MEITTAIACRVLCEFCPQELLIKEYSTLNNKNNINYGSPEIMSFEVFKTCLNKIPKSVTISFSGYTEPFLNPNCSQMILYAFNMGYSVQVFSTLVGLTIEDIDILETISFDVFHVHLPDKEMFAKIAVNEKYLNVVKKLVSSKIKNVTGMTMGTLHPKIKNILKSDIVADSMGDRAGNLKNMDTKYSRKIGPLVCNRASKTSLIDKLDENVLLPNGDVALCCNDYGLKNILGNLHNSDYLSLFNSETFENIYNKMKSDDKEIICRNCPESITEKEFNERVDFFNKDYSNDSIALSLIELYANLLGRFPDKTGFTYFYTKISNNEITIFDIENQIKKSPEFISIHPSTLSLNS